MSHALLRAILRRLDEVERHLRRPDRPRERSPVPRRDVKPTLLQAIDSVAAAAHSQHLITAVDVRQAAEGIGIGNDAFLQTLVELRPKTSSASS